MRAEGERVENLVLLDVARRLHVLRRLGEDEAPGAQQHHSSRLRLSAVANNRKVSHTHPNVEAPNVLRKPKENKFM